MVHLTTASRLFCLTLLMQFENGYAQTSNRWFEDKYKHTSKPITVTLLKKVSQSTRTTSFEDLLDPLLIPRVPGTQNHAKVKQFIKDQMKELGWSVETDSFNGNTPHGIKPFENIIATLNQDTPRRLVIACHYDSKYSREDNFVGATDSAVPCAMMIHLAHTLKPALDQQKNTPHNVTLQFIFFDGEEAFVEWNHEDSIYGSRNLAKKWESTPYTIPGQDQVNTNYLHRMDVMVLLDLLGTVNPKFYNYFDSTSHWHNLFVSAEEALRKNRLWTGRSTSNYFQDRKSWGGIEDDHIPFIERGVDILHVIPSPFPRVWHTPDDNKDALHFPTIENLNKILRVFVTSYLHLDIS